MIKERADVSLISQVTRENLRKSGICVVSQEIPSKKLILFTINYANIIGILQREFSFKMCVILIYV